MIISYCFDQLGDIGGPLLHNGNVYNRNIKSVEIVLYIIMLEKGENAPLSKKNCSKASG